MTNSPVENEPEESRKRVALRSREVFLDTEIYRRLGFEVGHPSLESLLGHIDENRLALHLTDITRWEIERQLSQQAREAVDELERTSATLAKWQLRAPNALGATAPKNPIDRERVSREAVSNFENRLRPFTSHNASGRSATDIFRAYFERRAPFDSRDAKSVKEFSGRFRH